MGFNAKDLSSDESISLGMKETLVKSTRQYYVFKSREWMNNLAGNEYIVKIDAILAFEKNNLHSQIGNNQFNNMSQQVCLRELFTVHQKELSDKGTGIDCIFSNWDSPDAKTGWQGRYIRLLNSLCRMYVTPYYMYLYLLELCDKL